MKKNNIFTMLVLGSLLSFAGVNDIQIENEQNSKHVGVVLLNGIVGESSVKDEETFIQWYEYRTQVLAERFEKALNAHSDTSLVMFPEWSLYPFDVTLKRGLGMLPAIYSYDSPLQYDINKVVLSRALHLNKKKEGGYAIDMDDSSIPLIKSVKKIQELAKKYRVTVVLNTLPLKMYPDRKKWPTLSEEEGMQYAETWFKVMPEAVVFNSALIIDSNGSIEDFDTKTASTNQFFTLDPISKFALKDKKIHYFTTKDGDSISYINFICAEVANMYMYQKFTGANVDLITFGLKDWGNGLDLDLQRNQRKVGLLQPGGYILRNNKQINSGLATRNIIRGEKALPLLNKEETDDYLYADLALKMQDRLMGEVGEITLTDEKKVIELKKKYKNPVVFANLPTRHGKDSAVISISKVESDKFTIQLVEAVGLDSRHMEEEVSYMVLDEGSYKLSSGQILEVGKTKITKYTHAGGWESVYHLTKQKPEVVVAQIQNRADIYISPRINKHKINDDSYDFFYKGMVGEYNFELMAETTEGVTMDNINTEIGWLIVSVGKSKIEEKLSIEAGKIKKINHRKKVVNLDASLFENKPSIFATINSYKGKDSAHLRRYSLDDSEFSLMIEEDKHKDKEMRHISEKVGYIAIEGDEEGILMLPSVPTK